MVRTEERTSAGAPELQRLATEFRRMCRSSPKLLPPHAINGQISLFLDF